MKRIAGILATAALAAACSGASSANASLGPGTAATELTIYAAASLKGALETVRTAYEATIPGVTLTIATDASSTLRTQIEQGAPADVFLSADSANPDELVRAGLADGAAVVFAASWPTVIVPADNPAGIASPADLGRPGVRIIAAGADVPISAYAERQIALLAGLPGYPADFAARYRANIVSKEQNVRAVLAKIELGEGDAAIVYATDAKASAKVRTVTVPATARIVATYAGVVVRASQRAGAAHAFLAWLAGARGNALLGPLGFSPAP
jgi:molybdate transport system substrate-binding protein